MCVVYIYIYIHKDGMAYMGWYICCISWSKQVCCLRILKASPVLLADLTLDTVQTVGLVLEARGFTHGLSFKAIWDNLQLIWV